MGRRKAPRQRTSGVQEEFIRFRVTRALKKVATREAVSENRSLSNWVRKLMIEELKRRKAFTTANIQ